MRKLECVDREKFCDELYKLILNLSQILFSL